MLLAESDADQGKTSGNVEKETITIRPLRLEDFINAKCKVRMNVFSLWLKHDHKNGNLMILIIVFVFGIGIGWKISSL